MPGPTDQYRTHHAVDEPKVDADSFRPFWRRRTRLDQLLIDRAITVTEWRAGVGFRTLAETVLAGSWHSPGMDRADNQDFATGLAAARRVDALNRLGDVRAALGSW